MKVTGVYPVGDAPDVLAFDSSLRRLYVSAESGNVAVFGEYGNARDRSARVPRHRGTHRRGRPSHAPRLLPAPDRIDQTGRNC